MFVIQSKSAASESAEQHVIHKNQASNRKSGLAKLVNSINA